jgi:hypothetical protein
VISFNSNLKIFFFFLFPYKLRHGISCRKTDLINGELVNRGQRISLTFRKIRSGPCKCQYFAQCNSMTFDTNPDGILYHILVLYYYILIHNLVLYYYILYYYILLLYSYYELFSFFSFSHSLLFSFLIDTT